VSLALGAATGGEEGVGAWVGGFEGFDCVPGGEYLTLQCDFCS
jgi:hypothetical protein